MGEGRPRLKFSPLPLLIGHHLPAPAPQSSRGWGPACGRERKGRWRVSLSSGGRGWPQLSPPTPSPQPWRQAEESRRVLKAMFCEWDERGRGAVEGEGLSPSTPNCAPPTHTPPGWTTHARTQTPSLTCHTAQPLLHTYPNSKLWSVSTQLPHNPAPLNTAHSELKSGPPTHTRPLSSPHNFSRCRTPCPAPALQPLRFPPRTPPARAPSAPHPHTLLHTPGHGQMAQPQPCPARPPAPSPPHPPLENDSEATPARHAQCFPVAVVLKGDPEEMPTSGGEGRGGREDERKSPDHPLPARERIKPKIGGVTLLGAPDTYTLLFVTFLCLPPPSSRVLSLPFPPSRLPSLASFPLSHALPHPACPSPGSGSGPPRPPRRPPPGPSPEAGRPRRPRLCPARSSPLAPFLLPHSLPSILNTWDS